MRAEKREATLMAVMDHDFSQEIYTKLIGERIRKVSAVSGAELDTGGCIGMDPYSP